MNVEHPPHYTASAIEPLDVITMWARDFSWPPEIAFHLGSALKYIARHQLKGNPTEDLEKARVFLDRALGVLRERGEGEVV